MASATGVHKYIEVKVPEGFLPQSIPVKHDERISSTSVHLETITKDDLMPIVCFPLGINLLQEQLRVTPSVCPNH